MTSVRSAAAEAAFRARLVELGAELLEPVYLGRHKPHRIRCAEGHEGAPTPGSVLAGQGVCRICAGKSPAAAEAAFRARLTELGAALLEPAWLGTGQPHAIRCAAGHFRQVRPINIHHGQGACHVCSGYTPEVAEAAFRVRLAELGAVLLEPAWLGSQVPHQVRCAAGHRCAPWPAAVLRGQGICPACRGAIWDVLYVVTSALSVKFGITSGDPRPRLAVHHKAGYRTVARLATGLPDGAAPSTERAIRAALESAGERPVKGREYYDISCLALILDIADGWLKEFSEGE